MGRGDRLCFRLKSRFPVFYQEPGDPRPMKAFSTDLSTSGIGILTSKPLEKGTVITLRLDVPGFLRKVRLQGRVVHQRWSQGKSGERPFHGILFEEVSDKDLEMITRFILKQLHMTGLRAFVLLTGLGVCAAVLLRSFYFHLLSLFQGTAFGGTWLTGPWKTLPAESLAAFYGTMAILILAADLCFFFMKKNASRAVLAVALAGSLDQGIRVVLKIPYLFQGLWSAGIFGIEAGLWILWGALLWGMVRHGGNYEQILDSIREDAGFCPASPEPPPKPAPPAVNHVFLP